MQDTEVGGGVLGAVQLACWSGCCCKRREGASAGKFLGGLDATRDTLEM